MNCLEAGARVAPAAMSDVQVYPLGRWTLLKNPFVKRSKPAVPVAPVQGELLLDLVRPIRNDLSDSDLEIVPALARGALTSPRESSSPGPALADGAGDFAAGARRELVPEPAAWDRVKEQFFGTDQS